MPAIVALVIASTAIQAAPPEPLVTLSLRAPLRAAPSETAPAVSSAFKGFAPWGVVADKGDWIQVRPASGKPCGHEIWGLEGMKLTFYVHRRHRRRVLTKPLAFSKGKAELVLPAGLPAHQPVKELQRLIVRGPWFKAFVTADPKVLGRQFTAAPPKPKTRGGVADAGGEFAARSKFRVGEATLQATDSGSIQRVAGLGEVVTPCAYVRAPLDRVKMEMGWQPLAATVGGLSRNRGLLGQVMGADLPKPAYPKPVSLTWTSGTAAGRYVGGDTPAGFGLRKPEAGKVCWPLALQFQDTPSRLKVCGPPPVNPSPYVYLGPTTKVLPEETRAHADEVLRLLHSVSSSCTFGDAAAWKKTVGKTVPVAFKLKLKPDGDLARITTKVGKVAKGQRKLGRKLAKCVKEAISSRRLPNAKAEKPSTITGTLVFGS